MKRQFEFVRGKTRLGWEIERKGLVVSERSWGRNRDEHHTVRRFSSEASAERALEKEIAFQKSRRFVEVGPGAPKAEVRPTSEGPPATAALKRAIVSTVVPHLRALGFQGTFPSFRRVEEDRHSVIHFSWGRNQAWVTVHLGVVPPKSGTSVAEDYRRSINIRNRERTPLRDLLPVRDWKLFDFSHAAEKWGARWSENLAGLLKKALGTSGVRWLEDPARRAGAR